MVNRLCKDDSNLYSPPGGKAKCMRGPPFFRYSCSPCSPYCSSTPPRAKRRAPRTDGPLMHFASPSGGKYRLSWARFVYMWYRRFSGGQTPRAAVEQGPRDSSSRDTTLGVSTVKTTGIFIGRESAVSGQKSTVNRPNWALKRQKTALRPLGARSPASVSHQLTKRS